MPIWELAPASPERDEAQRRWEIEEAWAAWAKYSCVERHGDHLWQIELDGLENEGGSVSLSCRYCPASSHDLYPDGIDVVYGEVDGIPIENGTHRSLVDYTAPVTAELHTQYYPGGPWGGDEWDVWVTVESVSAVARW